MIYKVSYSPIEWHVRPVGRVAEDGGHNEASLAIDSIDLVIKRVIKKGSLIRVCTMDSLPEQSLNSPLCKHH